MIKFLANLIGVHELVVQMVILPYTYLPQSKELMSDVRSYVSDYRIIENVYAFDYNDNILMTDLVNFCVNKDFSLQQRRLLVNLHAVDMYLQTGYFPDTNMDNHERRARLIWGLLTREQRTQFINEYILHSV
jgi:hypothetical protein